MDNVNDDLPTKEDVVDYQSRRILDLEAQLARERERFETAEAALEKARADAAAMRDGLEIASMEIEALVDVGYERITALGGTCDDPQKMKQSNPILRSIKEALDFHHPGQPMLACHAGELAEKDAEIAGLRENLAITQATLVSKVNLLASCEKALDQANDKDEQYKAYHNVRTEALIHAKDWISTNLPMVKDKIHTVRIGNNKVARVGDGSVVLTMIDDVLGDHPTSPLLDAIDAARGALEWYASPEAWKNPTLPTGQIGWSAPIEQDRGVKARAALAKLQSVLKYDMQEGTNHEQPHRHHALHSI